MLSVKDLEDMRERIKRYGELNAGEDTDLLNEVIRLNKVLNGATSNPLNRLTALIKERDDLREQLAASKAQLNKISEDELLWETKRSEVEAQLNVHLRYEKDLEKQLAEKEREREIEMLRAVEWKGAYSLVIDRIDMQLDEFYRIGSCHGCTDEIRGLCERAAKDICQHVPVITQRDEAIEQLVVEKALLQTAIEACAEIEQDRDAARRHFELACKKLAETTGTSGPTMDQVKAQWMCEIMIEANENHAKLVSAGELQHSAKINLP